MKLVSLLLLVVISTIPVATSMLQIATGSDLMCINIEEEQSEKESEENQEDKLVHETIELDALNSEFQLKITLPRQTSLLYNFQSYRGIITPPPEII
jgi:hypothetical protein